MASAQFYGHECQCILNECASWTDSLPWRIGGVLGHTIRMEHQVIIHKISQSPHGITSWYYYTLTTHVHLPRYTRWSILFMRYLHSTTVRILCIAVAHCKPLLVPAHRVRGIVSSFHSYLRCATHGGVYTWCFVYLRVS